MLPYSDDEELLELEVENSVKLQFESIEEYSDYLFNQVEHIQSILIYNYTSDSVVNLNGKMEKTASTFLNKVFSNKLDIDEISFKQEKSNYFARRISENVYLLLNGSQNFNTGIASILTEKHQSELKELLFLTHN